MRQYAFFFLIAGLSVSCKENRNFSGTAPEKTKNENTPSPLAEGEKPGGGEGSLDGKDKLQEGSEYSPLDCDAAITKASLLTPVVQNGTPNNHIEYQISLTECGGESASYTVNKILFDINAVTSSPGSGQSLNYSLKIPNTGEVIATGILKEVRGKDLFNNTGSRFYHNATDEVIALNTNRKAVIFRVDLQGQSVRPLGRELTPAEVSSRSFYLDSFLQFGESSTVVKVPLQFDGLGQFTSVATGQE